MKSASNVFNLVQAYGGSIAGVAGIWTVVSVFWLIGTAAFAKAQGRRRTAKAGIAIASMFWMIHGFVWYYTIVQISAWDLFNSFHLGESEKRQQLFLIIEGATKLGLTSTTIIAVAQCIRIGVTSGEPDSQ
jgi:hypothetical protein